MSVKIEAMLVVMVNFYVDFKARVEFHCVSLITLLLTKVLRINGVKRGRVKSSKELIRN